MIRRIALLCPDPSEPTFTTRIPAPVNAYRALFDSLGVELVPHPWVDAPPAGVDGVLAALAWGYHFRAAHWEQLLARWDPALPLVNPPDVLAWNTRKTYLAQMGEAGVSVIPTLTPPMTTAAVLDEAFAAFATDELVIKPLISAGSHETVRLRRGDPVPTPAPGRMVQPFLEAISTEGELSLFYFGGEFSHAVRKRAAAGDFRVQPQHGGLLEALVPDAEVVGLARAALAAAPATITYARVDMIRAQDGRLALMELEAIEPDLYFRFAPEGGRNFGEAVLRAIDQGCDKSS